ncbi:MAG: hypothetical protein J7M10_08555 [Candidatus Cloacimonetes bacterium]|nr:hypothetical protein [Candidatus Cloacimonadota bacterium]
MSFFTDEWKKRRYYRNKDVTSIWKLIIRIILLILLILLVRFFSTGGVSKFWDYILHDKNQPATVIIEETDTE